MSKHEPGMAYNTKFLNKLFAVIAVLFLLVTVWMFLDDYIRPWKAVQLKGMKIKQQVLEQKIAKASKEIDQEKLDELEARLQKAEDEVGTRNDVIEKIQEDLNSLGKEIYAMNMQKGNHSALMGEYQFQYETLNRKKKKKKAQKFKNLFDKEVVLFNKSSDDLKSLQLKEKDFKEQIKKIQSEVLEIEKGIKNIKSEKELLLIAKKQSDFDPVFFLRNSPFIDYLDPTVKIKQVVMDNLTDDRYFVMTKKVDRCMTCHMFIDQKGYEDRENPFKTHPRLDELAVGLKSAHPMKSFGCTSCHGGEGHRVNDFNAPAHMPNNKEQEHEWVKKHHWHEPHKVPITMYPSKYSEASCIKCHQGVERVALADKLNHGKELVQSYGCYACHKIKGWEHLRKPGPSLEKITAKVNKEFIKNWVWSPHTFNPHSRMPSYFGQVNNSKPEFMKKNIAEVNAIAEYIVDKSKEYKPFDKYVGGDASRGKNLIQTVGCIACHQVEGIDEPFDKVKALRGPYLTGTGSKVDADWLVSWLQKPSHYQKDTIMPSFRLSKTEANDIAAYLLGLKNKKFESLKFTSLDKELRDELLIGYFSQFDPISVAKKQLEKLSDHERTLELGKRSIGKYGCYSCHAIEGFADDRPPIGPELSSVGSKQIHQFGFGQQKQIDHTRHAWFEAHLKDPRIWDIGVAKPFKDLNRMPNFNLSNEEIEAMTTVLLGQVSEHVPMAGKKNLTAHEAIQEKGRKVMNKYNCYGCHKIDEFGGTIGAAYSDDLNMGPPWIPKEGHRVQPDWLYSFLQKPTVIRPYLKVRMPSFHFQEGELNTIINGFAYGSDVATFHEKPSITWKSGEREAAIKIFNEMACISCHTGGFNNDEAQGPDLHKASQRLRLSWIEKWLKDPVAMQPYTPMPSFWDGGKISAVEGVLDDDPMKQIKAVAKYVFELGQKKSSDSKNKKGK